MILKWAKSSYTSPKKKIQMVGKRMKRRHYMPSGDFKLQQQRDSTTQLLEQPRPHWRHQMLMRVWRNRNACSLPVSMQNATVVLKLVQELVRWFSGQGHLLPSLATWGASLAPHGRRSELTSTSWPLHMFCGMPLSPRTLPSIHRKYIKM